jgi:hypothetical protein
MRPAPVRFIALLLLLAACGPAATPAWHDEQGYRWRDLDVSRGKAGFTALDSGKTGVGFANQAGDSILLGNRVLGQGAGVSMGDVDGDGAVDVFLAKTEGCSALFRNLGNWKFENITEAAGVGACKRHSTGSALADLDADGDLDLILLSTTGPNSVFVNDGKAKFTERRDSGLDSTGRGGTTVALADIDGTGRLAMFVANYKPYFVDDSIEPQRRAFNQMIREVAPKKFEVVPEHRRDYKLVMRPDIGGLRMTQRAEVDELYLNDGKGKLTLASLKDARFLEADGKPVSDVHESFGLGARFADFNGDGAPDLYVANDFEDQDELWINNGKGTFRLADWTAQRQISNSTMGLDVADVNGDGLPDLFLVDMLANDSKRLRTQAPTNTAFIKKPGAMEMQLQHQRNTLFINRGDGTFAEVSQYAGVQASGWSWGTVFLDVDLDGWQDILVANGHLWDIMDADVLESVQNRLTGFPWQRLRWQFPQLALPNVAFRNRGDLTFEDASKTWGFAGSPDISHGIATGDLDGDGDLDVVVNRLGAPALVMRNNAPAARVAIRLSAAAPNTRAIGAKLTLRGGATPLQVREVTAGGIYMSHSDYLASFAMGAADSATLEIAWRDGRRTEMTVRANRLYEISDATALTVDRSPLTVANGQQSTVSGQPLFADATSDLKGHKHTEPEFDDWGRQFLIPDALSPLGPGIAWFDADRDGAEDLIVGAGKGGRIALFSNSGGRLAPASGAFPAAPVNLTGVVGLADGATTRILAGASTWQALADSEMIAQPAVLSVTLTRGAPAARAEAAVGSHASSTGPIALGDYDNDGRVDMFVGSRAVPLKYPLPATSGLFRNTVSGFVHDDVNAPLLRDVGMVSAGMFADITGDGHADLVLAREWDSILLLVNDGKGKYAAAPAGWGLGKWKSRWNGVAAGDVDGDGRLDIVATSWGRNGTVRADSANPLVLFHGAVGARGEQETILARHDPRVRGLAPISSYARVRTAMPGVTANAPTFAAWADATVEKALGPMMARVTRLEANTLDNVVLLNRGDRFEARAMPMEAQFAPAFYAGVADFNGDGREDVFLGQNFSQTTIGWPRDDAGRGLLMLGADSGRLVAMRGAESGLRIYGDQRGAGYADYDGDGRLDLAVSQNGAATRLFHNQSARPGLRVRLNGSATNPDALGAQVRVVYGAAMGPVREIQAGGGYWSQNGAVQVFGLAGTPTEIWVRWPGGAESRAPVPSGAREVAVTQPPK